MASYRLRVVVALPDVTESRMVADWLSTEGLDPVHRPNARAAADEIQSRPFDLLIADATFVFANALRAAGRPRRPDTPTIIVGDAAAGVRCDALGSQAMFLQRPLDSAIFVCTVSMALMDARLERRSIRRRVNRFEAVVNGVPSLIIDISNEGLRLEMPRHRRMVPPPLFSLRVPLVGVAVTVQRMWALTQVTDGVEVTWCGGALGENPSRAEQGWRSFVDTVPADAPSERIQIK